MNIFIHNYTMNILFTQLYSSNYFYFMQKLESVLENETNKIFCDIEIETDHSIPAKRPDLVLMKKQNNYFAVLVDYIVKKVNKYLDLARVFYRTWGWQWY